MFTHSPPFWYRPAAALPPSAPSPIFMGFDDVYTADGTPLLNQYVASKSVTFTGGGLLYDIAAAIGVGPANAALSGGVGVAYFDGFSGNVVLNYAPGVQLVTFYLYGAVVVNCYNASGTLLYSVPYNAAVGPAAYYFHSIDLSAYPGIVNVTFAFNTLTVNDGFVLDNISITPA